MNLDLPQNHESASHRAGRYMRTGSTRAAYVPSPLNHARALDFDLIEKQLSRADRALGRAEGALLAVPDAPSVLAMLRRGEAVASSQLEGVQASLLNLMDAEAGISTTGSSRDIVELRALVDVLGADGPLDTVEALVAAHDRLLTGMGRRTTGLRRSQSWVGAAGATLTEARFVPPPPAEITMLLADWQQFLKADDRNHPLVRIALAFAQLDSIQPFQEANGRIARAFLQQQLHTAKLLSHPVLLWSRCHIRERHAAQRALHALRVNGEVEAWVVFFLEVLTQAALETAEMVQRIVALRERHRAQISSGFGRVTPQALQIVDALIACPMLAVKDIIEITGTSFPAANELAQRLVRAGLLAEVTGNARNRRFRYAPYVRLHSDAELDFSP